MQLVSIFQRSLKNYFSYLHYFHHTVKRQEEDYKQEQDTRTYYHYPCSNILNNAIPSKKPFLPTSSLGYVRTAASTTTVYSTKSERIK